MKMCTVNLPPGTGLKKMVLNALCDNKAQKAILLYLVSNIKVYIWCFVTVQWCYFWNRSLYMWALRARMLNMA